MIGTLRNVFLSPSLPPSKYLAVHLLIILSRLLEEGDPTARHRQPGAAGGPFDGKRRGSNQERNSKMAVVKRLHNALAKEFFFAAAESCANRFSFFGTFPQTEKRVQQRQWTKGDR